MELLHSLQNPLFWLAFFVGKMKRKKIHFVAFIHFSYKCSCWFSTCHCTLRIHTFWIDTSSKSQCNQVNGVLWLNLWLLLECMNDLKWSRIRIVSFTFEIINFASCFSLFLLNYPQFYSFILIFCVHIKS